MIVVVVVMIFHDAAAADDSVVEAMGERLSGKHFLLAEALELSRASGGRGYKDDSDRHNLCLLDLAGGQRPGMQTR